MDGAAIGGVPVAPLCAIDPAKVAIGIGPFIPNGDAMFVERFHISLSPKKPEELMDNGFEVQLLGGENREPVLQGKAGLCAKDRVGAGASPIFFKLAVCQNQTQEVEILNHIRFRAFYVAENFSSASS